MDMIGHGGMFQRQRGRILALLATARRLVGFLAAGAAFAAGPVGAGAAAGGLPHGLRGVVEIVDPWRGLRLSGIGVLVAAVCALGFWFWWRRRQLFPESSGPLPDDVARARLQRALELIDHSQPFVAEVSEAVRTYLEARFGLRAPERTTEEFIEELRANGALAEEHREALDAFLGACDLVKFAGVRPGRTELEELHLAALKLVNELTPAAKLSPTPTLPRSNLANLVVPPPPLPPQPTGEGTGS